MKNILNEITNIQLKKDLPFFKSGDTIVVNFNIIGDKYKNRKQNFEGIVIARKNNGITSSFTVRKNSLGEGIEKVFLLHSPAINSIKVLKIGEVRKSKLYYIRQFKNKNFKIKEKIKKKER